MNKSILMWVIMFVVLAALIYPTAFDKRADIFAQTKWGADTLGLVFSYTALWVGITLARRSGGMMQRGLWWFNIGMLIMGSSFWFGPILNHYKLVNPDSVEGIHGVLMLGGMIGYLVAIYWLLRIGALNPLASKKVIFYLLAFFTLVGLYYSTMFVVRTPGNNIKYWAELSSFGIAGIMVVMAIFSLSVLGGSFRRAFGLLLLSNIIMATSYPFGPISQPNHLWTGAQGGTLHHGIMAVSVLVFLATVLYFKKLQVYGDDSQRF